MHETQEEFHKDDKELEEPAIKQQTIDNIFSEVIVERLPDPTPMKIQKCEKTDSKLDQEDIINLRSASKTVVTIDTVKHSVSNLKLEGKDLSEEKFQRSSTPVMDA